MDIATWQRAFGDSAGLLIAGSLDDSIPAGTRAFLERYGFPKVFVCEGLRSFEFRFHQLRKVLSQINHLIEDPEDDWDGLLVIGEFETLGINWFVVLDKESGRVSTLDVEADNPLGVFNSSLQQLGESMIAILDHCQQSNTDVLDFSALAAVLEQIDTSAYNASKSYWRYFVNHVQDVCELRSVTCNTSTSRSRF